MLGRVGSQRRRQAAGSLPEPGLPLALVTLASSLAVVLVGGIVFDEGFLVPLLAAAAVAALFGLGMGFRWSHIEDGILRTVSQGLVAVLILLLVGILIGVWILGGTVPLMLDWGLALLSPTTFLAGSFAFCALFALANGTSFGTIGSAGLALLGVGQAMDYPLGLTVGAIVGGAYLGDKASPVSDTSNTAAAITGIDLFRHLSSTMYVTIPAGAVTLAIYGVLGFTYRGGSEPGQVETVQRVLDQNFSLNPLVLLPPVILILLAVRRVPAIPTLFISIVAGAIVAAVVAGANGTEILRTATTGYDSQTGNKLVDGLLSSGGIESMFETIGLLLCALALGGVLEATGILRVIIAAMLRKVRSTGTLIVSVLASCWVMLAGTGNIFVAIIVPGRAFVSTFKERGIQARVLSRTLEDGGTIASPLVPWSLAAFFIVEVLDVPATTYAPFVFFALLCPVFSILFGFTGYAIFREPPPEPARDPAPEPAPDAGPDPAPAADR